MQGFELEYNTKIFFGTGILKETMQKIAEYLVGNILIVTTGRSLIKYGYLDKLMGCLKHIETVQQVAVYDSISQNPKLEDVVKAIKLGREIDANLVIGFGGGSALDAAKAAAIGIPKKADIQDMEQYLIFGKEPEKSTLPIVAIPTTAGTGSELSKGAILSSEHYHIKSGIRGAYIIPKIAIVDAEFTWTVPEQITMETGFDVLAHAIESYVAQKANLFSEMLSEKAIEIVGPNLRRLKKNLDDHVAREELCYASMIMGLNLVNVGTCLPHRIQYPIGEYTQTTHAAGLVAVFPAWLECEYEVNSRKIETVFKLLDIKLDNGRIVENFRRFQHELGIDYTLKTLGIESSVVEMLTDQITGNLGNDKLYQGKDILFKIIRNSL